MHVVFECQNVEIHAKKWHKCVLVLVRQWLYTVTFSPSSFFLHGETKILRHTRFRTHRSICCVSSLSSLSALEAYANFVSIWICISKRSARDHWHAWDYGNCSSHSHLLCLTATKKLYCIHFLPGGTSVWNRHMSATALMIPLNPYN